MSIHFDISFDIWKYRVFTDLWSFQIAHSVVSFFHFVVVFVFLSNIIKSETCTCYVSFIECYKSNKFIYFFFFVLIRVSRSAHSCIKRVQWVEHANKCFMRCKCHKLQWNDLQGKACDHLRPKIDIGDEANFFFK